MLRFLRSLFTRKGRPDPDAFFAELRAVYPGRGYTNLDRYRDFRAVFLGSDAGKRVLYEILSWCRLFRAAATFDSNKAFFREGERNIGLRIMASMNAEPSDAPTRAQSTAKGDS